MSGWGNAPYVPSLAKKPSILGDCYHGIVFNTWPHNQIADPSARGRKLAFALRRRLASFENHAIPRRFHELQAERPHSSPLTVRRMLTAKYGLGDRRIRRALKGAKLRKRVSAPLQQNPKPRPPARQLPCRLQESAPHALCVSTDLPSERRAAS
jgi:hypothetical protein